MRLLIVEDEARMADLLRKGLTEEGHTATCAADGSCMHACPVAIDTGRLVKDLRQQSHPELSQRLAAAAVRFFTRRVRPASPAGPAAWRIATNAAKG